MLDILEDSAKIRINFQPRSLRLYRLHLQPEISVNKTFPFLQITGILHPTKALQQVDQSLLPGLVHNPHSKPDFQISSNSVL